MAKRRTATTTDNLTPWQRGQSGNPSGRPRKVLNQLQELTGLEFNTTLSREDKFTILESLLEMPLADLKTIATDSQAPAFVVIAAKAILSDASKSRLNALAELFDRFYGKPKQAAEITAVKVVEPQFKGFDFLKPIAQAPEGLEEEG